jgi:protein-S-isoprenylcysteine O-methyltransferase Ste14
MTDYRLVARKIRVPLGFAFAAFYFWIARPNWLSIAVGAAVAVIGLAIRASASGHVVKDRELTTSGPYAYTRHPLYLGSIIVAAGFAIAGRSPWIVVAMVILFVVIYIPVIRLEEYYLRGAYRERFDEYARAVPALVPRLSPFRRGGAFSRERYWKNREYNALLGSAAMLAALIVKKLWFMR